MIERKKQHSWTVRRGDEMIAAVDVENGDLTVSCFDMDTLEEYKEFHQALGEAITVAEAQNEH
jgi:hypothetical protein